MSVILVQSGCNSQRKGLSFLYQAFLYPRFLPRFTGGCGRLDPHAFSKTVLSMSVKFCMRDIATPQRLPNPQSQRQNYENFLANSPIISHSKNIYFCGWECQILGRQRWKSRAKTGTTVIFPGKSEAIVPIVYWRNWKPSFDPKCPCLYPTCPRKYQKVHNLYIFFTLSQICTSSPPKFCMRDIATLQRLTNPQSQRQNYKNFLANSPIIAYSKNIHFMGGNARF